MGKYLSEVRGRLRVSCPTPLGQRYLVPLLVEFTQRYPQVDVLLSVEDRMVDLNAEHIDVAIRVAHLEDSTLVARKLTDSSRVLVAAPGYLQRRGTPSTPADGVPRRGPGWHSKSDLCGIPAGAAVCAMTMKKGF